MQTDSVPELQLLPSQIFSLLWSPRCSDLWGLHCLCTSPLPQCCHYAIPLQALPLSHLFWAIHLWASHLPHPSWDACLKASALPPPCPQDIRPRPLIIVHCSWMFAAFCRFLCNMFLGLPPLLPVLLQFSPSCL